MKLTVDVDASSLLKALDALGPAVGRHVKAAASVTADAIVKEAHGRIARRAGGPTRARHTAEGIHKEETRSGDGYIVVVDQPDMPGLPGWLEFGTKYMSPRPFLFNSARLEEGAHLRRVADALQAAVDEAGGLGS